MSDALDLSRLRALAQQAKDESPNERWYEPMQIEIRLGGDGDFISACSPDVILHLVQLVQAAGEVIDHVSANEIGAAGPDAFDAYHPVQRAAKWKAEAMTAMTPLFFSAFAERCEQWSR